MRGVAGQEDTTRAEPLRHLAVALEAHRVLDVDERHVGVVGAERGGGVDHEVESGDAVAGTPATDAPGARSG